MPAKGSRSAAKREEILKVATELFLDKGFSGVSVDEIVQRAGGSKTNVYTHFGGKDGLFAAIVDRLCEQIVSPLTELELAPLCPEDALQRLGETFLKVILAPPTLALHRTVVAEAPRFPDAARRFFEAAPQTTYRVATRYIRAQQAEGKIGPGNASEVATLFIDALTADFQLRALLNVGSVPTRNSRKRRIELASDLFLRGLRAGDVLPRRAPGPAR